MLNFADAWFMSGLAETDENLAEIAMKQARKAKDTEAQCSEFLSGKKMYALETPLPFSHFKKDKLRLLTKGSLRLVRFFKAKIFDAIK